MSASELWEQASCSITTTILSTCHTTVCTAMICTIIYVYYQLIANRNIEKSSKLSQKCGYIFILSVLLAITSSIITFSGKCYKISWNIYQLSLLIYYTMFGIHSFVLIIIFFDRINRVFYRTPFQLSKCTKYSWYFILTAFPLYLLIILIGFGTCSNSNNNNCFIWVYLGCLLLFIYVLLLIALTCLFINKLIQVYNNDNNNQELIKAITKMTILASLSVFITFLDAISTIFYFRLNNIYSEWISIFIALADIYTNFICIVFCYKYFKPFYNKLCKCLDMKCRKCWIIIISKNNANQIAKIIESQSSRKNTAVDLTITTTTITGSFTRPRTETMDSDI